MHLPVLWNNDVLCIFRCYEIMVFYGIFRCYEIMVFYASSGVMKLHNYFIYCGSSIRDTVTLSTIVNLWFLFTQGRFEVRVSSFVYKDKYLHVLEYHAVLSRYQSSHDVRTDTHWSKCQELNNILLTVLVNRRLVNYPLKCVKATLQGVI